MGISSAVAQNIAKLGVNLEITSDSSFSATTVEILIKIVIEKNSHITIYSENYSSAELEKFAKIGGANVTITIND